MSPDESERLPHILMAKCSECGTVLTAPVQMAGQTLSCPACLADVLLPPDDAYVPKDHGPSNESVSARPMEDAGTTEGDEASDSIPLAKEQPSVSHQRNVVDEDESIETIPLSKAVNAPRDHVPMIGGTYGLGQVHDRPVLKIQVFEAIARVKREKVQPPPKSLFFSNVFEFPWRTGESLSRWLWIALGISFGMVLAALCVSIVQEVGAGGWLLAGFFVIALAAVELWSLCYASACANVILQETAAGNDVIEGWPDGGVREWIFEFMPMVYIYSVSGFVALIVAMPMELMLGYLSPQLFALQVFTFPVTWLCALDSHSIWLPFSPGVIRTLRTVPRTWWQFWGLSSAIMVAAGVALFATSYIHFWLTAILAGPVVASVFFIYPRLLGRLVWQVSNIVNQAAKDRAPKPRKQIKRSRPVRS